MTKPKTPEFLHLPAELRTIITDTRGVLIISPNRENASTLLQSAAHLRTGTTNGKMLLIDAVNQESSGSARQMTPQFQHVSSTSKSLTRRSSRK